MNIKKNYEIKKIQPKFQLFNKNRDETDLRRNGSEINYAHYCYC